MDEVLCTIEGTTFTFFLENKSKDSTFAGLAYFIDLVSPTAKLDSPYSDTIIKSYQSDVLASDVIKEMAAIQNITVDYQIIDWLIANYAISINDETPLSVIRRVAGAVGGIIQTKPNGDLLIISAYDESPKDWDSLTPITVFSEVSSITEYRESLQLNSLFNAFIISNQMSSAERIWLEELAIDDTTKEIKGFKVPFTNEAGVPISFDLKTSGGPLITIDKTVDPFEEQVPIDPLEWEYVEFIDYKGKTKYPIYSVIDFQWKNENLGAFQTAEDGSLSIITPIAGLGESLLKIKYKTKYWKWTVTGPLGNHIQFYVPEVV
jgi:hypothetical protein